MDDSWVLEHVTSGIRLYLEDGDNTIGRHSRCKFVLTHKYLSRNHVNITVSNNRVAIQLKEAVNGVYVNDQIVQENGYELHENDQVCLGVTPSIQKVPVTYAVFLLKKKSALVDPVIVISDDESDGNCDINEATLCDNNAKNPNEPIVSSESTCSKSKAETTSENPNSVSACPITSSQSGRILHMPKLPALKQEILNETTSKICDIFGEVDECILDPLINISPYVYNKLQNPKIATTPTKKLCDGDTLEVADDGNFSRSMIPTSSLLRGSEVTKSNDSNEIGHLAVSASEISSSVSENNILLISDNQEVKITPFENQASSNIDANMFPGADDYDEDIAMSQALLKEMKAEVNEDDFDISDIELDFSPSDFKIEGDASSSDEDVIVIDSDDDADLVNKTAGWSSKLLSQTFIETSQIYPKLDIDGKSSESEYENEDIIVRKKKSKSQRIYSSEEENADHTVCKADSTISSQPKDNKSKVHLKSSNSINVQVSTKADEVTSSLEEGQKAAAVKSESKDSKPSKIHSRRKTMSSSSELDVPVVKESSVKPITEIPQPSKAKNKPLSSRMSNRSKSICVERSMHEIKTHESKLPAKPTRLYDDYSKIPPIIDPPHLPKHKGKLRGVSAVKVSNVLGRSELEEPVIRKEGITHTAPKGKEKPLSSRLLNRSKSVCIERPVPPTINAPHLPKHRDKSRGVSGVKTNDVSSRSGLQEPVTDKKGNKPTEPSKEKEKRLSSRLLNRSKSVCIERPVYKEDTASHNHESKSAKTTRKRTISSDDFENGPSAHDAPHLAKHKGKLKGASKEEQRKNAILEKIRESDRATDMKAKWFTKPKKSKDEDLKEKRREELKKLAEKQKEAAVKSSTKRKRKATVPTCSNTNRGEFLTKDIEVAKKQKLMENVKPTPKKPIPKRRATIESFSQCLNANDTELGPPIHYSRPPERKEARTARFQRTCNRVTFAEMEKEFNIRREIEKKSKRVRFNDNVTIHYIERIEGASVKVDQQKDTVKLTLSTYSERAEWARVHKIIDYTSRIVVNILSWANEWLKVRNADQVTQLELLLPMPHEFQSNAQYVETIVPLMKLELVSNIERDYKLNTATFKAKLQSYTQHDKVCMLITNYESVHAKKYGLYTLSSGDALLNETFASLSSVQRVAGGTWETIFQILSQNVSIENLKFVKTLIVRPVVENMRVELGAFNAVYRIKHTPLYTRILSPCKHLQPDSLAIQKRNSYKGVFPLNDKQLEICMRTYDRLVDDTSPNITLIQGPPGTGKSLVISNLALQCMYGTAARMCDRKILICSHSNTAVNSIAEYLKKTLVSMSHSQFKLLRYGIYDKVCETLKSLSVFHYFELEQYKKRQLLTVEKVTQLKLQRTQLSNEIAELSQRMRHGTSLQQQLQQKEQQLRQVNEMLDQPLTTREKYHISKRLVREANIVCTTLSSCVNLSNFVDYFDICIIDEATQCTEPWTLLPLRFGVRSLVLVGDTQQLPATVISQKANQLGLGNSMFARLERNLKHAKSKGLHLHTKIFKLNKQYRMHPEICKWPNQYFYERQLINASCTLKSAPIIPYCVVNLGFTSDVNNCGIHNDEEANFVAQLLEELTQFMPLNEYKYGVITPYTNHCDALCRVIPSRMKIAPQTVDSYQGLQCDVAILSYARTRGVGFLKNYQRLNVALTRPRRCLIICGNFKDLRSVDMWKHLLNDAATRNVYFNLSRQDCQSLYANLLSKILVQQQ